MSFPSCVSPSSDMYPVVGESMGGNPGNRSSIAFSMEFPKSSNEGNSAP